MKTKSATRFDLQYVGENLYRNKSSGIYYALFKRDGKQIRKSLKTAEKAAPPVSRRLAGSGPTTDDRRSDVTAFHRVRKERGRRRDTARGRSCGALAQHRRR